MGANFYGEIVVRITSETSGLTRGVAQAEATTAAMGKTAAKTSKSWADAWAKRGLAMQNFGRTMSQFVTLPIAAGFGVASIAAFKFQDSLMKIQNLTGTSAEMTKQWGDELLRLGGVTGQTPLNLAEALYFVASSGFHGADALSVVNSSAKAAAAGLGDVMVTADVLTSAMNAYGHSAYTAAEVTDILMKTVEVGKAEPTALAHSLGRIMPVAAALKVPLEEVGGMVAGLTLGGLSSAEAVTALRGTMMALSAPAKMSIDKLKELGLSYQEVTRSIREKGLIATLQMLYEKTDGNMLAMRKIIPNVRAINGVFSLLGANYKRNVEVTKMVTNAHGALNRAMANTRTQDVQKLRQAWAQLQAEFIKIGAMILPTLADIAKKLAEVVGWFNKLPEGVKQTTLVVLALTAALGPLSMIIGSVMRSIALVRLAHTAKALTEVGAAATTTGGKVALMSRSFLGLPLPVLAGIAAITAAGVGLYYLDKHLDKIARKQRQAVFQPEVKARIMDSGFDKEIKKLGYDRVEIDGVVYYNYTLKPVPEEGRGGMDEWIGDDAVLKAELRAREVAGDLSDLTQRLADQVRSSAMAAGGPDSLMVIMGLDDPKNTWRDLAIIPRIDELKAKLGELYTRQAAYAKTPNVPLFAKEELDSEIAYTESQLAKAQGVWLDAQLKMSQIASLEPEWNWFGGAKAIREQARQYKQDVMELLGLWKLKVPKVNIDTSNSEKKIKNLNTYLDKVMRSRTLTVKAKVQNTETLIRRIKRRLDEIGDEPQTAELRLEKTQLEETLTAAQTQLIGLRDLETETTVTANTEPAIIALDGVMARLNSLDLTTATVMVYERTVPIPPRAWGGIITKPEINLVGEAGPEVIIPLTKPRRAQQLLEESGLAKYTEDPVRRVAGPQVVAAVGSAPAGEVHYHSHVTVPQGVIVDDTQRFARRLSPWQEREMRTAQRRRQRGRAPL